METVKLMRKLDRDYNPISTEASSEWDFLKEFLPLAIAEFNDLGLFVNCNLAMSGLLGLSQDEMKALFQDQVKFLRAAPSFSNLMSECMGRKTRKTFKTTVTSEDGTSKLLMGVVFPRLNAEGVISGHLLSLVDVSGERDLRSQVRYQQSLLKNLLSSTDNIIVEFNKHHKQSHVRTFVPKEWEWKRPNYESAFESVRQRLHPQDVAKFDKALISISNKRALSADVECRLRMSADNYATYSASLSESESPDGVVMLIVLRPQSVFQADVGSQVKPLDQEAIDDGLIARFINHEIKNMLTLIQLESSRGPKALAETTPHTARALKAFQNIHRTSERIVALIDALERLRNNDEIVDLEIINMRELLEDFIHFIGKYLKMSDVKVLLDCPDSICLKANSILLQVVLMNLFKNALESLAQTEGRVIRLKVSETRERVVMTFEDNGPGIAAEVVQSLFDIGSSSKGEGRGLGLYLSLQIINKMNGELKLKLMKPACFEMSIPVFND